MHYLAERLFMILRKKSLVVIASLLIFQLSVKAQSQTILGTISFPKNLKESPTTSLPSIPLYISGHKLQTSFDKPTKKILFHIPKKKDQTEFYVLITKKLYPQKSVTSPVKKQNIIEYLKIDPEQLYKYYKITLKADKWVILRQLVDENTGRIPDNTIIVFCPPEFVQELQGDSEFEFPSIIIKPDLLSLYKNKQDFQNACDKLLIKAINIDTIHTTMQQIIKTDACRIMILPTAA